jgi:hypothetical protein
MLHPHRNLRNLNNALHTELIARAQSSNTLAAHGRFTPSREKSKTEHKIRRIPYMGALVVARGRTGRDRRARTCPN